MLKAQVLCTADKSTKLWLFHMVKIANGIRFIHCMETCTRIIYIYLTPHVRSSNTVRLYMWFCIVDLCVQRLIVSVELCVNVIL